MTKDTFVEDYLYGKHFLDEVLLDLIACNAVQRLKKIYQGGASHLINSQWNVTRYQHSVGTMLLIRKLGGSLEEQIVGLIHDISHTAFSHVTDLVLASHHESYHEQIYDTILYNSEIPSILDKYGYSPLRVSHIHNWTILDKQHPDLCADRIDYTLRDLYHWNKITLDEAHQFLAQLKIVDNTIVCTEIGAAEWFVRTYSMEVIDYFLHPLNMYAYDLLSDILRQALQLGLINLKDLLQDDAYVLEKLKSSNHPEILLKMKGFREGKELTDYNIDYSSTRKSKPRFVDPLIYIGNDVKRASELSVYINSESQRVMSTLS